MQVHNRLHKLAKINTAFSFLYKAIGRSKRGVAIFAKDCFGILAGQSAKITRPLMPSAAPAVLVTRSPPN
ncbi:hypothetical protein, partial [Methylovulum psychrotolerans]|uniref:hypothetical protein n=1 Tax=Methylovulum psychrotolerans TaxID=1704499 RepID=UPI001B805FF3